MKRAKMWVVKADPVLHILICIFVPICFIIASRWWILRTIFTGYVNALQHERVSPLHCRDATFGSVKADTQSLTLDFNKHLVFLKEPNNLCGTATRSSIMLRFDTSTCCASSIDHCSKIVFDDVPFQTPSLGSKNIHVQGAKKACSQLQNWT